MPDRVEVFFFKVWNDGKGEFDVPRFMTTADGIARVAGAEILTETKADIDADELDADGRYDPEKDDVADDQLPADRVAQKPPVSM
jgi:hypothetical protein